MNINSAQKITAFRNSIVILYYSLLAFSTQFSIRFLIKELRQPPFINSHLWALRQRIFLQPLWNVVSSKIMFLPIILQYCSKVKQCFFIKGNVASSIINKYEYSSSNKMERAITGEMIKEVCIPVKVDRLGRIIKLGY